MAESFETTQYEPKVLFLELLTDDNSDLPGPSCDEVIQHTQPDMRPTWDQRSVAVGEVTTVFVAKFKGS